MARLFEQEARAFFLLSESLAQLIGEYIPVRKFAGIDMACCPFHPDHRSQLEIHSDRFSCRGCGATGDVVDFVMRYENVDIREAFRLLAERGGPASVELIADLKQSLGG